MHNNDFVITIAGIMIRIDTSKISDPTILTVLHQQIRAYYALELVTDFRGKPDFTIYYVGEEEHRMVKQQKIPGTTHYFMEIFIMNENDAAIHYHASIAQFQFFLKMILQTIIGRHNGFILHASAISDRTNAYLFVGPNGIGKSTIVTNCSAQFLPFADDMVIVRKHRENWYAYQLPLEKKKYKKNPDTHMRVRSICYLEQSRETKLSESSALQVSKKLLDQLIKNGASEHNVKALLEFLGKVDHYIFQTPLKTDIPTIKKLVRRYV